MSQEESDSFDKELFVLGKISSEEFHRRKAKKQSSRDELPMSNTTRGQNTLLWFTLIWIVFFGFYWGAIFLATRLLGVDMDVAWNLLGPDTWHMQAIYYGGPIPASLLAAALSGVFHIGRLTPLFPWARIVAFAIMFWILDGAAFGIGLVSPKIGDAAKEAWIDAVGVLGLVHSIGAPVLAVIITTSLARLMSLKDRA